MYSTRLIDEHGAERLLTAGKARFLSGEQQWYKDGSVCVGAVHVSKTGAVLASRAA